MRRAVTIQCHAKIHPQEGTTAPLMHTSLEFKYEARVQN